MARPAWMDRVVVFGKWGSTTSWVGWESDKHTKSLFWQKGYDWLVDTVWILVDSGSLRIKDLLQPLTMSTIIHVFTQNKIQSQSSIKIQPLRAIKSLEFQVDVIGRRFKNIPCP